MKYFHILIIIIIIFSIIFINILNDQVEFVQAITWPASYDTVSVDSQTDKAVDASGEHEIYEGQAVDTFHNIFARFQIKSIPSTLLTDTAYEAFLNPPGYGSIWYRFKLKYLGSSQYNLIISRSTDNQSSWTNLEARNSITLTEGEYDSGTLGTKKTNGTPGYIEFYTKKTYIEEPASSFNHYYRTLFGSLETEGDRTPDTGTSSRNLSEPINQLTTGLFTSLAPSKVDQGQTNVQMSRFALSTNANSVEWTALRIDKRGTSVQDADVDRIKIWKDNGNQTFETDSDMLVANALNAFVNSVASITLNPTQILTTTNAYYFITYDINWFANPDKTIGMYIGDKTYFTVSSPDNVKTENFPFETGNSKIISANYLSFFISGIGANINIEGETTDLSVGGSGWIDLGGLVPNDSMVVAQKLNVTTNAETGYRITIQEDKDLTNLETQEIIPDVSGTNASPTVWPSAGGFGYHTSDDSLGSGIINRFSADDTYAAIVSNPEEVAYYGSAINGQVTSIVYKLEIGVTQAVGKYSNVVTYVCTTTY